MASGPAWWSWRNGGGWWWFRSSFERLRRVRIGWFWGPCGHCWHWQGSRHGFPLRNLHNLGCSMLFPLLSSTRMPRVSAAVRPGGPGAATFWSFRAHRHIAASMLLWCRSLFRSLALVVRALIRVSLKATCLGNAVVTSWVSLMNIWAQGDAAFGTRARGTSRDELEQKSNDMLQLRTTIPAVLRRASMSTKQHQGMMEMDEFVTLIPHVFSGLSC